jgi:phenylalanyl-tRNA synthetase beta chain
VSEISLTKLITTLPTPSVYDEVKKIEQTIYKPFSIYPAIVRDVAMWVNEGVEKDYVYRVIAKVAGELCVKIALFDEFTKDSRISYAFRLVFQADDRTLTDEDVESYVEAIYKAIKDAGFEVR